MAAKMSVLGLILSSSHYLSNGALRTFRHMPSTVEEELTLTLFPAKLNETQSVTNMHSVDGQ